MFYRFNPIHHWLYENLFKNHTETKKVPSIVIGISQGHHKNVRPRDVAISPKYYRISSTCL